ncbi:MAG: hypothetical protein OXI43_18990 [Candidatus Poribacteria bacterium]|nr:hypothetical protein [Candidatus Poribacteria bacterium]
MISMRSFLTRNAFYLFSVLLLTIITVQIVMAPQLNAHEVGKKKGPPPLPMLTVEACTGSGNASLSVDPSIVNWDTLTLEDHGTLFEGTATGHTEQKRITSVEYKRDENGQTVPIHLNHKKILAQVAFGDISITGGLTAAQVISLYKGKSKPTPQLHKEDASLDDWFSLRSASSAGCAGNLGGHHDDAAANYESFMVLGFPVCDGTNHRGDGANNGGGEEANNFVAPDPPTLGITLANSDQTFEPGDSVTLDIVTADPFYDISWYVHTPWDTSSSGTYLQNSSGDGTSTSASLSYTFPSGAMHTGDFVFRAYVYKWSDMSYVGEETYTVSVSSE